MVEHLAFNQIVEGSIPSRPTNSLFLMATCPRCHGHLTDGHKCPRSRWAIAIELFGTAMAGGLAALAFVAIFDPEQLTIDLDGFVFALGAMVALGAHQLFTWRRR